MRSLPRRAQVYLSVICLAGLLSAGAARFMPLPRLQADAWEILIFVAFAVYAGRKKIVLMRHKAAEDVGSMSLGFALTFASMLRFGPSAGLLVGGASCLAGCLFPKRQPAYQIAFNVALTAVETWTSGLVFLALNGWNLTLSPVGSFGAIAGSCLTYFAVNTGGVATIIALCTGESPVRVWKDSFLWTAPSYFAGAGISALALLIFGNHTGIVLLFGSPVAGLTYYSYFIYTRRAEENQQHIEEMQISQAQLAELYLSTINCMAQAIDAKDPYTHQHIMRVQRYAVATAMQMGLTGAELEGVNTGALLHDIGKIGVPEYVLGKPGRLTNEEFGKIKKHPEIGADILQTVAFPYPVLPVVKYHHEKWNGTGYPEGLRGADIPLGARILAVADVYDALTSYRSYRSAWSHERAVEHICEEAGSHFDPDVVEAFIQVIEGTVRDMAEQGIGPLVEGFATAPVGVETADPAARDIQRVSCEVWALYEVAQTLSASLGLQETVEILARKLEAIFVGAACVFLLRDEDTNTLVARAAAGVNRDFFDGCRTLSDRSQSVTVVRDRASWMGAYDSDDLLVNSPPASQWVPLSSALIVPIVHEGQVLGTINLYHPRQGVFGTCDRQLLETIAERAALALYNGLLHDRTRSHALTDPLTGLCNLRRLTQHLEERCEQAFRIGHTHTEPAINRDLARLYIRREDRFALLCLDLNCFKPVNDNFGHVEGDRVLRDLAVLFRQAVREGDLVARYGGDEFLIVLAGTGPEEARAMTEHLRHQVENYNPGLEHPRIGAIRLSISVGCACFPEDGQDGATLLSVADMRMYAAKSERKLVRMTGLASPHASEPSFDTEQNLDRAA